MIRPSPHHYGHEWQVWTNYQFVRSWSGKKHFSSWITWESRKVQKSIRLSTFGRFFGANKSEMVWNISIFKNHHISTTTDNFRCFTWVGVRDGAQSGAFCRKIEENRSIEDSAWKVQFYNKVKFLIFGYFCPPWKLVFGLLFSTFFKLGY